MVLYENCLIFFNILKNCYVDLFVERLKKYERKE